MTMTFNVTFLACFMLHTLILTYYFKKKSDIDLFWITIVQQLVE